MYSSCLYGESYEDDSTGCNIVDEKLKEIANLQKEKDNLIKYLEDKINMCDGYIDTAESDLEELKYTLFAYDNMKKSIEKNKFALKIYQDILERVKSGKYDNQHKSYELGDE